MKRDMELVRKILIALEDSEQTQGLIPLTIEGYSQEQVSYHIKLLADQRLVDATDLSDMYDFEWRASGLTWDGHDYIEVIRDNTRWQKVKDWVKNAGKVLTIETMKLAIEAQFF